MTTFNDDPHPRVLFFEAPIEVRPALESLVPTFRHVDWNESLDEAEWDAVVTFEESAGTRSPHLHVLSFGAYSLDMVQTGSNTMTSLVCAYESHGEVLTVGASVGAELAALIGRSIVPNIGRQEAKPTWGFTSLSRDAVMTGDLQGNCTPLLTVGSNNQVMALSRRRDNADGALCWALPHETVDHGEWFRLFLKELATIDPDVFENSSNWQQDERWATPSALEHFAEISSLQAEREAFLKTSDAELATQRAALERQIQADADGPHRLLTAQDEPLVDAVADALSALGFKVTNMDPIHVANHNVRFEDLQVHDPDDPDWSAIVEVKGFKRGVKVNEIDRITRRPYARFCQDHGRPPSAVWAIANHDLSDDPGQRRGFVGNPAVDLHAFADLDGGAGIDTRDLYLLWREVAAGGVSQADARASLRGARVLWRGWEPGPA